MSIADKACLINGKNIKSKSEFKFTLNVLSRVIESKESHLEFF